jgi:CTP synthase
VPFLSAAGELKTKPTQHSVKELLSAGVQPDILVCRTEHPLSANIRRKLSLFCNLGPHAVIEARDANSIYDVPILMLKEKLDITVISKLRLVDRREPDLRKWKKFLGHLKNPVHEVRIGLIGKYIELQDAYKSILEAFVHAGVANECKVQVVPISSDNLTVNNVESRLDELNGILVAPGFGERGIEGKITAIQYARENNLPFFGICLGMQCAVVEFARNVLGLKSASSTEMNEDTKYPVISLMADQKQVNKKGGTMRLGAYPCDLVADSKVRNIYKQSHIQERHRHRYEFNNEFLEKFKEAGLKPTGINPKSNLVEVVEIPEHNWFVGVQFHPEYKSTVENPHPLFVDFVKHCIR